MSPENKPKGCAEVLMGKRTLGDLAFDCFSTLLSAAGLSRGKGACSARLHGGQSSLRLFSFTKLVMATTACIEVKHWGKLVFNRDQVSLAMQLRQANTMRARENAFSDWHKLLPEKVKITLNDKNAKLPAKSLVLEVSIL